MLTTALQYTEIQQHYAEHVNDFYNQVRKWIFTKSTTSNPLELVLLPDFPIEDQTGNYTIDRATIEYKEENEKASIDLVPVTATPLIGDGELYFEGSLGEEHILYLCKETLQQIEYPNKSLHPILSGVNEDGWYWVKDALSDVLLINDKSIFDIMYRVSFYEP